MSDRALNLAARVVRQANREHPADAVLRAELKKQRGFAAAESRFASRALFAHYRWLQWLDPAMGLPRQLQQAMELQARFESDPSSFTDEELLRRAVPEWTTELVSVSAAWVRALQAEPRLWIRLRRGVERDWLRHWPDLHPVTSDAPADAYAYTGDADLFRTDAFQSGRFEIQDLSSQAVSLLCAPQPGETWWDACAGEGGKMLHLADLMQNKGLIWATDRAAWRLQRLKRRASRAQVFNYRAALWTDWRRPPIKTRFDGVLVDAPCSGIGTWHRNPQGRWTIGPPDVAELAELQFQLLQTAATLVKPGGRLIYSVCTLARPETDQVADRMEKTVPDLEPQRLSNPFLRQSPSMERLWMWPQEVGGNGMFVAAWQKK